MTVTKCTFFISNQNKGKLNLRALSIYENRKGNSKEIQNKAYALTIF